MALERIQGKTNATKCKPFGFCHKRMRFKMNQLMSYLCIKRINISECDRRSNSLILQFSSKVIFIHNCEVYSPVFNIYTWTVAAGTMESSRYMNTKHLQQENIILPSKAYLITGGEVIFPDSFFAFLSFPFCCLLAIFLLSQLTEIRNRGRIYWNLAVDCYYISPHLSIFFRLGLHGVGL